MRKLREGTDRVCNVLSTHAGDALGQHNFTGLRYPDTGINTGCQAATTYGSAKTSYNVYLDTATLAGASSIGQVQYRLIVLFLLLTVFPYSKSSGLT